MTLTDYLQSQPLVRVAAAFIIGIVAGDKTATMVPAWLWLASAATLLLLQFVSRGHNILQSACIFAVTACIGAALSATAVSRSAFPFQKGQPVRYEAVVTDQPKVRGKTLQCDLALTSVNGKRPDKSIKVRAAILRDTMSNNWARIRCGSGIEAWSAMQPLENYYHESNFDYARWMNAHGITAQTFIYYTDWQPARVSLKSLSRLEIMRLRALRLRERLTSLLHTGNDGGDQQAAVVAAMVLGDRHAVSKETKDVYSISGGSHILALSGLHLGIIYAILTLLFGKWHRRWLCQTLILTAIWAYVVIVGMGASVMRSALMLTIYSLCLVMRRDKASVNTLAFAAICLLAANPMTLWDAGFQMSFMAVLAIVAFYRPVYSLLKPQGKLLKMIWGMTVVSITAQAGTAPLVAYYFGRFSCYFLLTNYIVVPLATIIIYGGVALLITSPFATICTTIAKMLNVVAGALNASLSWVASLPGACIEDIHVSAMQVTAVYILVACVSAMAVYFARLKAMRKLDAFLHGQ